MASPFEDQAAALSANCVDVLPEGELAKRLEKADREGRPLRVKLGLDPTAPDIHLGHCVVLQKLRQFQDLGHTAVLIVGDYTARVGDPSGRSKTRPVLSGDEIDANAMTYQEQAFRVLDPERTEVRWNGEWLAELTPEDMFRLMRMVTVSQILEREDFARRYSTQQPISMLELLYPLMQGYDSVAVNSDIEFGGTDQLFNLLMGRTLMPNYGLEPQLVMTTPILPGTDGVQRMSKSIGNYIGVADDPGEMFGKVMSIPDEAMPEYYRLATGLPPDEAAGYVQGVESGATHPNHAKRTLARFVIERFYDGAAADAAEARFDTMFKRHELPDDIAEVTIGDDDLNDAGKVFLPAFLTTHLGVPSSSEARRLLQGGGVKVDGEQLPGGELEVSPDTLRGHVVQVGKRRFVRVR